MTDNLCYYERGSFAVGTGNVTEIDQTFQVEFSSTPEEVNFRQTELKPSAAEVGSAEIACIFRSYYTIIIQRYAHHKAH